METIINGLKTNRAFAVTSVLVLVLIAIAFAAPVLAPYDPTHATMQDAFMAPGGSHLFGTDKLGRDCLSRVLYGARASLSGVLFLVASVFIVGTSMGVISGYFGGKVDIILMRVTEIFSAIPFLPFALILSSVMTQMTISEDARIFIIMCILGVLTWPGLARLVRGQVLVTRENEYVVAAQSMGVKESRIAFKHILPNVISVILVSLTLDFAGCMLTESSLSTSDSA